MKKSFTLYFCFLVQYILAQHNNELYNNGTLLHVQSGANMYVLGDFHMAGSAASRLENYGFIEVEGNIYGTNLFQQRGTGTFRLYNRLVNSSQAQTIYGSNSYAVRGGQSSIGVDDGSFYNLELANDVGQVYLSGNGYVCDVRNAVNFKPLPTTPDNRIITSAPPPVLLPANGSSYPAIFGIMNTNTSLATVMPNNTISLNGNMSPLDVGYVQGKLRRAINPAGGNYHFVVGLEPAGLTAQRGVQLIRCDIAANSYDVITAYFETGSDNTIPGTPIECTNYIIDYFGGTDHGEWVFNQLGANTGTYTMNVWPQDHNFPAKSVWFITKDNAISGTPDQCGATTTGLQRGGFSGFSEFGVAGADIVLPLELLNFSARPYNNELIRLNWETASESNTSHFEIERSTDGIQYYKINTVAAAGNSNQNLVYTIDDKDVERNRLYYYRLKMVDMDQTFTYSNVQSAKIIADDNTPSFTILANPIEDNIVRLALNNMIGSVSINLYSLLGQSLYNQTNTISNKSATIYLENLNLAKGIYLLSINYNDTRWTEKIIKQ